MFFFKLQMFKLLFLLMPYLLLQRNLLNAQTNLEGRTKLCADPKCLEDLFPSLSIRDFLSQDPQFIQHKQNSSLKIYAFKFSNRPDFMEAETEDKKRGYIFHSHIDLEPYVIFLESALKKNKTLYMVDQETGKLIREVSAIPELARDYSAYALKIDGYPLDKELVNKLMAVEQEQNIPSKHGHHGHGHSHEHGHGHSHSHSNEQQQKNEEPVKIEKVEDAKLPDEKIIEEKQIAKEEKETKKEENDVVEKPMEEEKAANVAMENVEMGKEEMMAVVEELPKAMKMPEIVPSSTIPPLVVEELPKAMKMPEIVPSSTIPPLVVEELPKAMKMPEIVPSSTIPPLLVVEELPKAMKMPEVVPSSTIPPPVVEELPKAMKMPEVVPSSTIPPPVVEELPKAMKMPEIVPLSTIPPPTMPPPPLESLLKLPEPTIIKMDEEKLEKNEEKEKLAAKDFGENLIMQSSYAVEADAKLNEEGGMEAEIKRESELSDNKPIDSNGDGSGNEKINYCYKEDCQGLDQIPSDKIPPTPSTIHRMFRETMFSIRTMLPEPLCHFEDSGLILMAAILLLTIVHFTTMLLSKSSGPEPFDHRLLHDCITRLKEQELVIEQQRTKVAENQHLVGAARAAEEQLQKEEKILAEKLKAADGRNSELELANERLKTMLERLNNEFEESKEKVESLTINLNERELLLKNAQTSRDYFEEELGENVEKLTKSQDRVKFLEAELEEAQTLNEELAEETPEEGANAKLMDILEMVKLKSKLRAFETEKEQLKFSLKVEKEEKESVQKEAERLRQELAEKDRESEKRELDRHGLTQQCTKLLQMIEEKERKMEHCEQERERIRSRLSDGEVELRKVEDERREAQHRLKEVEQSLKRSEELNGRLENKLYHEERRFNGKIRQLEEQLSLAKSSLSPMNLSGGGLSSDLNFSGNSSDREFVSFNGPEGGANASNVGMDGGGSGSGGRDGGGSRSVVPSLWSEIDAVDAEPIELAQLERQGGSMRRRRSIRTYGETSNRNSPYLSDMVHISTMGREERLMNASKYSTASLAAAGAPSRQRMRSRSVGRQSARLTGVSSDLQEPFSSKTTLSKSNTFQKLSSSKNHLLEKPSSPKTIFLQKPSSSKTIFPKQN